jgi:hypothetical protein
LNIFKDNIELIYLNNVIVNAITFSDSQITKEDKTG